MTKKDNEWAEELARSQDGWPCIQSERFPFATASQALFTTDL